jgi:uncharacterized peroxidase-related enzyme
LKQASSISFFQSFQENSMPRISAIDPQQAQGEAQDFLAAIQGKFNATPNFFRTIAHAPAMGRAFAAFNAALTGTRLSTEQRELIALTQAGFHGCPYCSAYHVYAAGKAGVSKAQAMAWLQGAASVPSDQALARFVRAVLAQRGRLSDADLQSFAQAGFDEGHMVEVMAVISANVFTNFINLAAQTEVDFPAVHA